MTARTITKVLGGDWSGRYGLVPGPGHSRLDRSLKIWADESGRILVHSFAGDDWRECRDYLKGLGWDIDGGERHNPRPAVYRDAAAPGDEADERRRIEYARKIFAQRRPAAGSPVETYIRARGAALPPDAPVFYHAACPNSKNRLPAMLCPITDIRTGEFTGLHRTFLRADGSGKADIPKKEQKKMLGRSKGGAIRLTPDEDVTTGLGICEGIETGLSILGIGWAPVWAALSKSGIRDFPVLDGIECLTVFADHDNGGMEAARECARRWTQTGREVTIRTPFKQGKDWNDAVLEVTP